MGSATVRVWQYEGPAEADLPQAFTLQRSGRYLGDLHVDFRMLKDFSVESLAALNMKIAWELHVFSVCFDFDHFASRMGQCEC